MPDDGAGAATADATADTTTTAAPAGAPAGITPGAERSAEDLLSDAVGTTDEDLGKGDDLAAQLKKAQADAQRWKTFARKHEDKVKELGPAAARLAEIEEASKTEAQKLADRTAAAEQRAAAAEGRYHRTLAAATYGLPAELIDLLGGQTEDEINSSAEALAAAINSRVADQVAAAMAASAAAGTAGAAGAAPQGAAAQQGRQRPVESMRAGAMPAGQGPPRTGSDWFRQQLSGAQNHA